MMRDEQNGGAVWFRDGETNLRMYMYVTINLYLRLCYCLGDSCSHQKELEYIVGLASGALLIVA